MNGNYIDTIAIMSGIVIIVAGFVASLIYCTSKEKDWKVVISVPTVIAVLIGVGYYGFGGSTVAKQVATKALVLSSKQTLEKYCEYTKNGDYGLVYDLYATDSPLRKSYTREQVIQNEQNYLTPVNGINTCTVNDVQENGDSATGFLTIVNGRGEVFEQKTLLKKEDYEWKIIAWS